MSVQAWRRRFEAALRSLAAKPGWCLLLLTLLPVALRLALLGRCPAPTPNGADDFAYLLLADTLRHGRLANAMHPMRHFFEAVFILQEPSYSSIFPLGQGIALAAGWMIFGHPWAGVILSCAAFSALCYWMLRGWVSPLWALAGGVLAVMQFGPLCEWMNLYWGGAAGAAAGCLAFGAVPRLDHRPRLAAALLGAGVGAALLVRPFESILLAAAVAPFLWKRWRLLPIVAAAILPAAGLLLMHNRAVTGNWTTLPYQLSQWQYGIPASFTVQPNPVPRRELTGEQDLDYRAQSIIHGDGPETPGRYAARWFERLRFYRFFFYAPLLMALPAFAWRLRRPRYLWLAATVLLFTLGTNFYPYFYPHYVAALTSVFVLIAVLALEQISRWNRPAAVLILSLCGAEFLFWYGLHAFAPDRILNNVGRYESWDFINHGDPNGRAAIDRQLSLARGRQLVFVRYGPRHAFHEWVHNAADIDSSRVVRALDRGEVENEILRRYYPDRTPWLLEPDEEPPSLTPYPLPPPPPPAEPPPTPGSNAEAAPRPPLRFEEGPVSNSGAVQEMQRKRR